MNWLRTSIKRRVFALLSGLALTLFVSYSAISIMVAYIVEDTVINQVAKVEARSLQKQYELTGSWQTSSEYFQIYDDLEKMPPDYQAQIINPNDEREIFTNTGRHFHFLIMQLGEKQVYLLAEVTQLLVVSNMSGAILIMTSLGLIVTFFLTIYVTYRISTKTVKPVTDLTDAVRQLDSKTNKLPNELLAAPDEIGFLAKSLQQSFDQLTTALERESEFTRDVSHELRTPVTVMKNMLQLNAGKPMTAGQQATMQQQLDTLNSQITGLLALARAESVNVKSVKVVTAVEEAVMSLDELIQSQNFEIEVDIPYSMDVAVNPHLFNLLIINLLENAMKHASEPKLSVQGKAKQLIFSNPSCGKVDNSIMLKAQKGNKSEGLGQGLFLVSRILDKMGWQYNLGKSSEQFSLQLDFAAEDKASRNTNSGK